MPKIIAVLLLILLSPVRPQSDECVFRIEDSAWARNDPLFLNETLEYLYPNNGSGFTIILPDQRILVSCGSKILINDYAGDATELGNNVLVDCQNSAFLIDNVEVDLLKLSCSETRFEEVIATGRSCLSSGIELVIGFNVNEDFVPLSTACYDEDARVPLYVHHNITKNVKYASTFQIYTFIVVDDYYYNLDVEFSEIYYNLTRQQETINKLIGLPSDSEDYIAYGNSSVLARLYYPTILTDTQDVFSYVQQFSLFRSINSVPIWQVLGNWFDAGDDIRRYISEADVDLEAYVGTYGISTLPHAETEEETELFLYATEDLSAIPVPQLIWRLIYDPVEERAIVLITVNSIYRVRPEDIICTDIGGNVDWLTWDADDVASGYSYACTYEDAASVITSLPSFTVTGILT